MASDHAIVVSVAEPELPKIRQNPAPLGLSCRPHARHRMEACRRLTLTLLMAGIAAHHIDGAFAAHHFAVLANPLDAGPDLHLDYLLSLNKAAKHLSISGAPPDCQGPGARDFASKGGLRDTTGPSYLFFSPPGKPWHCPSYLSAPISRGAEVANHFLPPPLCGG